MSQGFYELLGVSEKAAPHEIRTAYQHRLAELVRRRRGAQAQGADVSILEGQERSLREAMEILSDPGRRRRYDAYRQAAVDGLPEDAESLWRTTRASMVDPATAAAVPVLRVLTDLPLGDALPSTPEEAPKAAPQVAAPPAPAPRVQAPPPVRIQPPPEAPPPAAPPPRPPTVDELAQKHGHDGVFLGAVRELRGLTVDDLARSTRISRRYLEAIENNDFDSLPAGTFVRGYVRQIARVLELEQTSVVDDFMDLVRRRRG